jgi:hypothetical protein
MAGGGGGGDLMRDQRLLSNDVISCSLRVRNMLLVLVKPDSIFSLAFSFISFNFVGNSAIPSRSDCASFFITSTVVVSFLRSLVSMEQ